MVEGLISREPGIRLDLEQLAAQVNGFIRDISEKLVRETETAIPNLGFDWLILLKGKHASQTSAGGRKEEKSAQPKTR